GDERHDPAAFPPGRLDGDGQQIDLRDDNSWMLKLGAGSTPELLEVHAVNCLAPFLLLSRLEPLLRRRPEVDRYIVNVSAMEGQLNAQFKTGKTPPSTKPKAPPTM